MMPPVDNYEVQKRAEFISGRHKLLVDLEDRLSAGGIRHRRRARLRSSMTWIVAMRAAVTLRRIADVSLALFFLILLSPVALFAFCVAKVSGGGITREIRLGRWASRFKMFEFRFPEKSLLHGVKFVERIPTLINVMKGDMSFIGPRPIPPGEEFSEKRVAWKRYNLRPGLLSLWWIRKRANIAHSSEVDLDSEYVETESFWGDIGIAARAIPTALYGGGVSNAPAEIRFLGVRIDNLTMSEASEQIMAMTHGESHEQICFVNADCVNIACGNEEYRATLASAKLVLADGIGVRLAGSILDQNVRENVNGTDMLPFLCAEVEKAKLGLFLLGGRPGVAEEAAKWITAQCPDLVIAGTQHGYFSKEEEPVVVQTINASNAAVLLVALGAPRQDTWISEHKAELGPKVSIGVGGLFDFYSGRIPRAPVWVRELGMEWFYRFCQEPRRMWRRYFLGNAEFLWRVVCERIHLRTSRKAEGNA